jgi:hypothetical protein
MMSHFPIAVLLMILLLAIPITILAVKYNLVKLFSFITVLRIFNKALPYQLLIGIVILIISIFLDKVINWNSNENTFAGIIIETSYTYLIIGGFIYLPVLAVLNIINLIRNRVRHSK